MIVWTQGIQFSQPRRKLFDKRLKRIAQGPRMKTYFFFQKKTFSVNFQQKAKLFRSRSETDTESFIVISTEKLFKERFVWTKKWQLSQPHRRTFDKKPKSDHSVSKINKKNVLITFRKKNWGNSYFNVESNRFNPVEIVSRRGQKFFGQCPKMFKKLKVFQEKSIFIRMLLWICRMHFSQLHRRFFARRPKKFRSKSLVKKKDFFSKKMVFDKNNRMETKHAVFTTSPKSFRQKTKLFCSRSEKDYIIIFSH